MHRRTFLKSSAAATAAAVSTGIFSKVMGKQSQALATGHNMWPGRVVINFNKSAATNYSSSTSAVASLIRSMVNDAILRLTDQTTVGAAWKAVFPTTLTAQSKIAIKIPIGFANTVTAPHWSSVRAITDGLQQMDFGTAGKFPAGNITIYDRLGGGTFANTGYTATNFPGITIAKASLGTGYTDAARNDVYADALHNADFLINVFSPRGHGAAHGNFTLGFKNHYGTYPIGANDGQLVGDTKCLNNDAHDKVTSGTSVALLRDMNCLGVVLNKNVISMCSGIFGTQEKGSPGDASVAFTKYALTIDKTATSQTQPPCTIILSTDPISAEMQAIKMLRLNAATNPGTAVPNMPSYLQASAGVTGALSGTIYNIGVIDEAQMDIRRIMNGVTFVAPNPSSHESRRKESIFAAHLGGQKTTFIEFSVSDGHVGRDARIEIHDAEGKLVRSFDQRVAGVVNHLSWDEKNVAGSVVQSGMYVVTLSCGAVRHSARLQIVR